MYSAKRSGNQPWKYRVQRLTGATTGKTSMAATQISARSFAASTGRSAFNSGHPSIDADHRELFALANDMLDKSFDRRRNPAPFYQAFDKLVEHTVRHFSDEEKILAEHGYAQLDEHLREHRRILDQAAELQRRVRVNTGRAGRADRFDALRRHRRAHVAGRYEVLPLFAEPADAVSSESEKLTVTE